MVIVENLMEIVEIACFHSSKSLISFFNSVNKALLLFIIILKKYYQGYQKIKKAIYLHQNLVMIKCLRIWFNGAARLLKSILKIDSANDIIKT